MVLQHAFLEIRNVPGKIMPAFSQWIPGFFDRHAQRLDAFCRSCRYDPVYIRLWKKRFEYRVSDGAIVNRCTVYADHCVFEPLLRTLITELAAEFPQHSFRGSFRLLHSNWGFSIYPFRTDGGVLTWEEETLARQQPETRKFWDAMDKAQYITIRDLMEAMYAPMTGSQRFRAFFVLDDLFFDPEQEISPTEGYDTDADGNPEPHGLVEFTYMSYLSHCWVDYAGIWEFFQVLKEKFNDKNVPFDFPADFLAALE